MTQPSAPQKSPLPDALARLRRRAEQERGAERPPATGKGADTDPVRLLHELEVHKIELELQNQELRDARDQLEGALERLTDLYEYSPAGHFSVDDRGTILEVNLTGAALLGMDRSAILRRKFEHFAVPAGRPVLRALLTGVFERPERQICEVLIRRGDGTEFWAELQTAPAAELRDERRWCRVALLDISARKRAEAAQLEIDTLSGANRALTQEIARRREVEKALVESEADTSRALLASRRLQEQMRQLSHGILRAQEQERKRVSRELHDVIAQSGVGITLYLEQLESEATGKSALRRARIVKTRRLLNGLIEAVHRFSRELRPTVLDDLGLIPALRSLTTEFARRTGLAVELVPDATAETLDSDRTIVLYRVAEEALANVARHAHAAHVTVSLRATPDSVCIDIADDGRGFAAEHTRRAGNRRRLGLLGMRERTEMVGGSFSIESAPGRGTCVRARIPLADRPAPAPRRLPSAPPPR